MATQTVRDLKVLGHDRALLRVALGIMFFWTLATAGAAEHRPVCDSSTAAKTSGRCPRCLAALIVGVGLGSVLAGVWSGGKVELGILPLGAGGLALSALLLFTVEGELVDPSREYTWSYIAACALLVMLGVSAGLFDVPLAAFMQDRSPPEHRGSILAASNFLTFGGMLLASGVYWLLSAPQVGIELNSARDLSCCAAWRRCPCSSTSSC